MGIDFPKSPSAGDTYTYEGETYLYNGVAFVKVRDRVTTFNGATGAIIGVTSVQGKTGDVTLTDLEITHGVETFNGLSGSIDTTSLVLPVTGISASGGITAQGGLANISSTNKFRVGVPGTGLGGGPFVPNTYSFPTSVGLADSDGTNPSILVNRNAIALFSGDRALEWAKLGEFCVNSFNGVTGDLEGVTAFNGATGAIDTTSLVLPVTGLSASGGITLSGDISIAGNIIAQDNNVAIKNTTGELMISFLGSQTIINNSAVDQDIIVKGNGDSQLFVTDAGNNRVGIGTSTPTEKLDVTGTIKATTGITLGAGGITFPDGTFQDTAARAGLKYTVTSSASPSAGEIYLAIDLSGIFDFLVLHDTDAHGNDISGILSLFADNGGYIQVLKDDGSALIGVAVDATETSVATFGSDKLTIQQVLVDFEIEEQVPSAGDTVYIDINPSLVSAVQSIGGSNSWNKGNIQLANGLTAHNFGNIGVGYLQVEQSAINFDGNSPNVTVAGITFSDNTQQKTAPKGVGTFTVSASSAISTGAKTDALHRIPYNATLTKFELKSKATGGMTAAVYIAGSDFGNPTTGFITGATAEITGLTGETTTFGTASVTGGDFIYLHVLANASGATAAQAFVSYETR